MSSRPCDQGDHKGRPKCVLAVAVLTLLLAACGRPEGHQDANVGATADIRPSGPSTRATSPGTSAVPSGGSEFSREAAIEILAVPLAERYRSARYSTVNSSLYEGYEVTGEVDLSSNRFLATDSTARHGRWYGEGVNLWEIWEGRNGWLIHNRYPTPLPIVFPDLTIVGKPTETGARPPYSDPATLRRIVDTYITKIDGADPEQIRGRTCAHGVVTVDAAAGRAELPPDLAKELGRWNEGKASFTIDIYHDDRGDPCRIWHRESGVRIDIWDLNMPVDVVRPVDLSEPPARR